MAQSTDSSDHNTVIEEPSNFTEEVASASVGDKSAGTKDDAEATKATVSDSTGEGRSVIDSKYEKKECRDGSIEENYTSGEKHGAKNASDEKNRRKNATDDNDGKKDVNDEKDVKKDASDEKDGKKDGGDEKDAPKLPRTRIGRPSKDETKELIDQADWQAMVPKQNFEKDFVVAVKKGSDDRQQINIYSPYIQKVFREVIRYFPEVYVELKSITFSHPHAPFYFYIDQMQEYIDKDEDEDAQKDEWNDFRKHFYDAEVKPFHDRVRASLDDANIRFDFLWALFKPGELLYTLDDFDQPSVFVIGASTFRGRKYGANDFENLMSTSRGGSASAGASERFVIDAFAVTWKGSSKVFSRYVETFTINFYSGTQEISSFKIYPLKYYQDGDTEAQNALLDVLERRGRVWAQLVSQEPISKHHDGPARELNHTWGRTRTEEARTHLNERVIIDHDGIANYGRDKTVKAMEDMVGPMLDRISTLFEREMHVRGGGYDSLHNEFDWHPPAKPLTKLQAQLCPSLIHCFMLATNTWYQISVINLREVEWTTTAFNHLVMNASHKEMLRSIVEQHHSNRGKIVTDVIRGKGKGVVILLHGPPGVGKTLTAESVAEYTHKPLYSINIGELTAEEKVAARLQNVFVSAARWDAVLLLDEADVILEARSFEDFKRNGIVSVFLRMLEYYEGIMFLTTNRLSTMDTAFMSRIHIAIKFNPLTTAARKSIWKAFIGRLSDKESEGKEELLYNLDEMSEWSLNGREIRNVITIAQRVALAERRSGGGLGFEHVEQVADEALKFQRIFQKAADENREKAKTKLPNSGRRAVRGEDRMIGDY